MTQYYKSYKKNDIGTDFVCGDIHGCFEQLEIELTKINFNKLCDRLFVVGDLIDRGPQNELAFEYINYSWFFSIMGNHEDMLLSRMQTIDPTNFKLVARQKYNTAMWYDNGGEWWQRLSENKQSEYYNTIRQLPLVIELSVGEKQIGLIHAELYRSDWSNLIETVSNINDISDNDDPLITQLLWSRKKINVPLNDSINKPIDGIDHIFHGHTILDEIVTIGNCTYIDTGCYRKVNYPDFIETRNNKLTILDIKSFLT